MDCGVIDEANPAMLAQFQRAGVCGNRNAVYDIGGGGNTPVGCYRDGGAMPAGLTLVGNAYLDFPKPGPNLLAENTDHSTENFGIHFDGSGDYATISGVDSGDAS
eukprot:SAG11_NODE_29028_length_315_cov_0.907407_1_plen_104_part_11